jgi:miniconductance mechanosensitive channel
MSPQDYIHFFEKYNNAFTQEIHLWVKAIFSENWVLFFQITIKSFLIVSFYIVSDILFRKIFLPFIRMFAQRNSRSQWLHLMIKRKAIHSILHVIPALAANLLVPYVFYHHPMSFDIAHKIYLIFLLVLLGQLWHRIMLCVEDLATDENNYRSIAVSSFGQLLRIVGFIIISFLVISTLFDFEAPQVLSIIGAITAVILLVFRDPILGFVAGVHAASSHMIKKGDWIFIPKHNLEGYVKEISLITVKIEAFDKTISSIPTYDLISTEIKNNESIFVNKQRLIRRSVFLNINSFRFLEDSDLEKYAHNKLLSSYIEKKMKDFEELKAQNQQENKIFDMKLTNVGLFRVYIYNFLLANPHVVKNDILMVRQREISTQGLPIEVFCFANTGIWEKYEQIQSDIFDFVLTSAKEFELEVVQTGFR